MFKQSRKEKIPHKIIMVLEKMTILQIQTKSEIKEMIQRRVGRVFDSK